VIILKNSILKNQKGYALVLVLLIITIIGIISIPLINSVISSAKQNDISAEDIELYNQSEMGMKYFQNFTNEIEIGLNKVVSQSNKDQKTCFNEISIYLDNYFMKNIFTSTVCGVDLTKGDLTVYSSIFSNYYEMQNDGSSENYPFQLSISKVESFPKYKKNDKGVDIFDLESSYIEITYTSRPSDNPENDDKYDKPETLRIEFGSHEDNESKIINPSCTKPVPINTNSIHLGGVFEGNVKNVKIIDKVPNLYEAISEYIYDIDKEINEQTSAYSEKAIAVGSSFADIQKTIASSQSNPVILKAGNITSEGNQTIETSNKNVIIILDSLIGSNLNLNFNGTLIIKTNLTPSNDFGFNRNSNNSNSNLWVLGSTSLDTQSYLNVGKTFYSGNLINKNNSTIKAENIFVKNEIIANTQLDLIAEKNIVAGSIDAKNNATIQAQSNDLFVRENITSNTNLTIKTGGSIAVGKTLDIKNNVEISNGGGYTSFDPNGLSCPK
jgi:competence protein ComGC